MLPYFKLAFRNIFRFKRRTFITFVATSLGLALLIITIALMNGIDKDSISNIINCQTSHIKVFKQGYFDKRNDFPLDLTIRDPQLFFVPAEDPGRPSCGEPHPVRRHPDQGGR